MQKIKDSIGEKGSAVQFDLNDLKSSRSIGLKKLRGGKNNYSINIDEAHILEFQVVNEGELSITPKILISNIITANE